jgi:sulfur carrier protein ThiS adenylyltransferase
MDSIYKSASVGVAGLGGLGSNAAAGLVRLGVGRLVIADFDSVERTNLNRQNYFVEQIGRGKVDASEENLRRMNYAGIEIEGVKVRLNAGNVAEVFKGCDVVLECLDKAESKQMLVETVLAKMSKAAVVSASGLAGVGRSNEIRTMRISKRHVLVGDNESGICIERPMTGPRVCVAAYHQANAAAELIIEKYGKKG